MNNEIVKESTVSSKLAYLPTPLPGMKASTEESNAKALNERIADDSIFLLLFKLFVIVRSLC